jgi:hypothetical protein
MFYFYAYYARCKTTQLYNYHIPFVWTDNGRMIRNILLCQTEAFVTLPTGW